MTYNGIENVPDFAFKYPFWVYNYNRGHKWWYSCTERRSQAEADAKEVDGVVLDMLEVKNELSAD